MKVPPKAMAASLASSMSRSVPEESSSSRSRSRDSSAWATDASYFRVEGWGYYYMVTVMDDYSRFIPSTSSGQAWPTGFRGI